MHGNRTYTTSNRLLAWINKKCVRCGKYISKFKYKYCNECYRVINNRRNRSNRNLKEYNDKYYLLTASKRNKEFNDYKATYMWAFRRGLFKND